MRDTDWLNPKYLREGTTTQKAAYAVLCETKLFELLAPYDPVLVGTIPLEIDLPGSDLDILCEVNAFPPFAELIKQSLGTLPDFYQNQKFLNGVLSHITHFTWAKNPGGISFPIEIVGQPVPVRRQRAFRHLFAEARLLAWGGESVQAAAREAIRALKRAGMKTEPAFAYYFGLEGEPFDAVLAVADWDDDKFEEQLAGKRIFPGN